MGIQRLMKELPYESEAIAVLSEKSMIPLCEKYDVDWVWEENRPLGNKHNTGLKLALKKDWDYMVNLGSDDIVSTRLFEMYKPLFGTEDFFGINDIGFFSTFDQGFIYHKTPAQRIAFGAARVISRRLAEATKGHFWPSDWNKTLDRGSAQIAQELGFSCKTITVGEPLCIDIKSDVNIWGYDKYHGQQYPLDYIKKNFSKKEYEYLLSIKTEENMEGKVYCWNGMTRGSKKLRRAPNTEKVRVEFSGGGFVGGTDGDKPELRPALCFVPHSDRYLQEQIENLPEFRSGAIYIKEDESTEPPEEMPKEAMKEVPGITKVQAASAYLRENFPDVKTTDVNTKAGVKAVADKNGIDFVDMNFD